MLTQMMFCETASTTGIELFNTISSFAYVIIGLYFIFRSFNLNYRRKQYLGMGFLVILLGTGSAILHITQSQIGLILDFASMFLLVIYILLEIFENPLKKYRKFIYALYFLVFFISILTLEYLPLMAAFILSSTIGSYFTIKSNKDLSSSKYLYLGIVTMVIAFGFWIVDFSLHCLEGYTFNGHSVWHVLTTIVIYCIYKLSFETKYDR